MTSPYLNPRDWNVFLSDLFSSSVSGEFGLVWHGTVQEMNRDLPQSRVEVAVKALRGSVLCVYYVVHPFSPSQFISM